MTILKHGAESGGDAVIDPLRFRPIVAGDAIAFYALKTLLPWPLAPDYGRTPVWLAAHPRQWVWAAAALVALTVGAASCRTRPKLGLAMVFFLAPLLPVLGFVPFLYQSYSTVADRYAYLALLGPAFLVGEAVVWAACHGRERRLAPAAAFLALLLIVLSWHQIPLWHDDVAWARYTIAFVPQAPSGYINLGLADMDAGDLAGARTALRTGLLACPGDVKLDHDMATLLMQAHEPGQAVKYLRICATKLGTADAYYDLGHGLLDAGETKPGLAALREAYQLGPDSTKAETIAIHLAQQGNLGGAEEWFSRALLANPNDIPAAFSLGMIAAQRGQTALARQRFQAVVQFAPQSPEGGMAANYLAKNP